MPDYAGWNAGLAVKKARDGHPEISTCGIIPAWNAPGPESVPEEKRAWLSASRSTRRPESGSFVKFGDTNGAAARQVFDDAEREVTVLNLEVGRGSRRGAASTQIRFPSSFRRVLIRGREVRLLKIGMLVEYFLFGHAGAEPAKHVSDRDPKSANARLGAWLSASIVILVPTDGDMIALPSVWASLNGNTPSRTSQIVAPARTQ